MSNGDCSVSSPSLLHLELRWKKGDVLQRNISCTDVAFWRHFNCLWNDVLFLFQIPYLWLKSSKPSWFYEGCKKKCPRSHWLASIRAAKSMRGRSRSCSKRRGNTGRAEVERTKLEKCSMQLCEILLTTLFGLESMWTRVTTAWILRIQWALTFSCPFKWILWRIDTNLFCILVQIAV